MLRAVPARQAAVRVRALRMAYANFERTMAMLDRLECLGRRLQSPLIIDVVIMVRERVSRRVRLGALLGVAAARRGELCCRLAAKWESPGHLLHRCDNRVDGAGVNVFKLILALSSRVEDFSIP